MRSTRGGGALNLSSKGRFSTHHSELDSGYINVECFPSFELRPSFVSTEQKGRYAFTLAEVLITLGIIGIVAAMTIPTLMANHKKQVTIERLKKAYSVVSQSVERSKVDYGDIPDWDWDLSSTEFMDKYFTPNMQITKNCAADSGGGCWSSDGNILLLNGTVEEMISAGGTYSSVRLSDGTLLAFTNQGHHAHVYIDVNGEQGPNTYGKDTFVVTLAKGPVYTTDDWGLTDVNSAGVYFFGYGYPRATLLSNCRKSGDGRYCGQLIMLDGWKMEGDYKVY